jgi:hypothetical protein
MVYADRVDLPAVRTLVGHAPFGAPLPFFVRVILSENRDCTFRDHGLRFRRLMIRGWHNSGAVMRRENEQPHPEVLGAFAPSLEGSQLRRRDPHPSRLASLAPQDEAHKDSC